MAHPLGRIAAGAESLCPECGKPFRSRQGSDAVYATPGRKVHRKTCAWLVYARNRPDAQEGLSQPCQTVRRRKAVRLPVETEAQFLAAVVDAAENLGWRTYHTWRSDNSAAGFPDLCLVHRRHGLAFLELKRVGQEPTAAQMVWLDDLATARQVFSGWATPAQWPQIMALLTGRLVGQALEGSG